MSKSTEFQYVDTLESEVLSDFRNRSKNALYRTDPEAWLYDVLGTRWHAKQREVGAAFMANTRTLVKSGNGSGKSRMVGELITWATSVFEIGEVLSICSAPVGRQIKEVTFAYLKSNYGAAKARGFTLPGRITDSAEWYYRENGNSSKQTLVLGQKPAERDIVSSFQGIRAMGSEDTGGMTWVFLDEAGGVPDALFTAAEAVTTGRGNKIMGIGNPDRTGNEFHRIFTQPHLAADWSLHTISVFDLPTITGEIVYPGEPAKQAAMLESGMNDLEWVEQKERAWGIDSARYLSKVLGEFPDSDDRSFFSQSEIDKANDTEIFADETDLLRGGLDVARFGEDDSMMYENLAGQIRRVDSWSKATTNETSSRAHKIAIDRGMHEVVVDAAGLGAGVMDQLAALGEGFYRVLAAKGAERSPDPTRWANARAYWYDMFREAMRDGRVDLDLIEDTQLRDELLLIQFDFTLKGAIKIESKKDMASRGVKSPDALDAVVYSFMDINEMNAIAAQGLNAGDKVTLDPWDVVGQLSGMPI